MISSPMPPGSDEASVFEVLLFISGVVVAVAGLLTVLSLAAVRWRWTRRFPEVQANLKLWGRSLAPSFAAVFGFLACIFTYQCEKERQVEKRAHTERVGTLAKEIVEAQARTAEADERAAQAEQKAAEAAERANNAIAVAATAVRKSDGTEEALENLARLQHVTKKQREAFVSHLKSRPGAFQRINVYLRQGLGGNDPYVRDFVDALKEAGVTAILRPVTGEGFPATCQKGARISIHLVTMGDREGDRLLREALDRAGFLHLASDLRKPFRVTPYPVEYDVRRGGRINSIAAIFGNPLPVRIHTSRTAKTRKIDDTSIYLAAM